MDITRIRVGPGVRPQRSQLRWIGQLKKSELILIPSENRQHYFRFYFHLLKTVTFLHFEVVLSGEKWSEVDLSGLTSVRFPF